MVAGDRAQKLHVLPLITVPALAMPTYCACPSSMIAEVGVGLTANYVSVNRQI